MDGDVNVVKLILQQKGININVSGSERNDVPLYGAAMSGHTDVVKVLLSHPEIDVNLAHRSDFTPLMVAAGEGHVEVS